MTPRIMTFIETEDGIIATEWVMMTAGCVALGLAALSVLSGGVGDLSGEVQEALLVSEPATQAFGPFVAGSPDIGDE